MSSNADLSCQFETRLIWEQMSKSSWCINLTHHQCPTCCWGWTFCMWGRISCWTHRGNSQLFIYRFRQWSTKILGKWREKRSGNIIVVWPGTSRAWWFPRCHSLTNFKVPTSGVLHHSLAFLRILGRRAFAWPALGANLSWAVTSNMWLVFFGNMMFLFALKNGWFWIPLSKSWFIFF